MNGVIKNDIKPITKRPTQLLKMLRSIGFHYRRVKIELSFGLKRTNLQRARQTLHHPSFCSKICCVSVYPPRRPNHRSGQMPAAWDKLQHSAIIVKN
ncbi:MAG: hypothetical protein WA020_12460 [Candidatus Acidiferrales bacterium]